MVLGGEAARQAPGGCSRGGRRELSKLGERRDDGQSAFLHGGEDSHNVEMVKCCVLEMSPNGAAAHD
jgi:hypothetical protein